MSISNFNDLLVAAKQQPEPHRLLFLFAQSVITSSESGQNRGTITPMTCVDKLPSELTTFDQLVQEADQIKPGWNFVFIASLPGVNGKEPTSEDASSHLEDMTNSLARGQNMSKYVVFDREEKPIFFN